LHATLLWVRSPVSWVGLGIEMPHFSATRAQCVREVERSFPSHKIKNVAALATAKTIKICLIGETVKRGVFPDGRADALNLAGFLQAHIIRDNRTMSACCLTRSAVEPASAIF